MLALLSVGSYNALLQVRLVTGDFYVLLASAGWAYYSWMLANPTVEHPAIRTDWSAFLLAQVAFGLVWSGLFAGAQWTIGMGHARWGWPLVATLLFVAVGPALLAFRAWGAGVARAGVARAGVARAGVARAGPAVAGFFSNLTPLFTALLSSAFLGEVPRLYHVLAFMLIMGGIVVSSRR